MSTSVSQSQRSNNSKWVRNWITAAGVILMLVFGFFVIRTQGYVSGVEFAPSHFQIRDFSFYEIPLLHHQITPIYRKTRSSATATYLSQKSLIPSTGGTAKTWHLVSISRGLTGTTAADASFLVNQLQLRSAGKDYWRQWSVDHPAKAALVWPHVHKLADRELYVLIPGLLDLVSTDSTKSATKTLAQSKTQSQSQAQTEAQTKAQTKALKNTIDEYLQDQYLSLIKDMAAADRQPLAAELLAEAQTDYPNNEEFKTISH